MYKRVKTNGGLRRNEHHHGVQQRAATGSATGGRGTQPKWLRHPIGTDQTINKQNTITHNICQTITIIDPIKT